MIGQYRRTLTATVSNAAVILGAALVISSAVAADASAQITPTPDTVRADTTNLLVIADTAREVKHVVKKGDTLWDLAQYYLKDPFRWPEIFRRNTDVVENPLMSGAPWCVGMTSSSSSR